ncbi:MAG: peptidylprolyl isomerase [Methanosarcinales archaeon]|nr:peptidylprolyl isomerase [Methanosarcinales archaeon]
MEQAKNGDVVKVHYTGKFEDGLVFDTSEGREPLQFKIGENTIIPGFEQSIVGMNAGEVKTVKLASEDAYGPHREELVMKVPQEKVPPEMNPKMGDMLQVQLSSGQVSYALVTSVSEEGIVLDVNHPLAGRDLVFDIKLLEIV